MDVTVILSDFIDEMLGLHGAYALTDIETFDGPADAAAFVRLRVRLCEAMLAEGWTMSPQAAEQLDRDRLLLLESDDSEAMTIAESVQEEQAMMRARAQRVREDARRTSEEASTQRRESRDAREEIEQMRQALASRAVIEQAKGIAMERYGLRPEVAWAWLVRTSQNRNVKLRVIAEELVASVAGAPQPTPDGKSPSPDGKSPSPDGKALSSDGKVLSPDGKSPSPSSSTPSA